MAEISWMNDGALRGPYFLSMSDYDFMTTILNCDRLIIQIPFYIFVIISM